MGDCRSPLKSSVTQGRLVVWIVRGILALLGAESWLVAQAQTCDLYVPESTPTAQFTVSPAGTATDAQTGLIWKRCSEGQAWSGSTCTGTTTSYDWPGAGQHVAALNAAGGFAGQTDWRLPNVDELKSIIETRCTNPSINATIFPATPASYFWTGSANATSTGYAADVYFDSGGTGIADKSRAMSVRLVRGAIAYSTVAPALLKVGKTGSGSGVIVSRPAGINCGPDCSARFDGSGVELLATPDSGSTFGGWRGDCEGLLGCYLSMGTNKSATGVFYDIVPGEVFPFQGGWPDGWIDWARVRFPKGVTVWLDAGLGGSNAPWGVAGDSAAAGVRSLKSGIIKDGERSAVGYSAAFSAGSVSFARRVSSESGKDFLEFYIDGVLKDRWSGDVPWSTVTFPLPAGSSMMMWRYVKDSITGTLASDAAWIDSVSVRVSSVPGTPVITGAAGKGRATLTFTPPSDGGSPITAYTATCSAPGNPTKSRTASSSPLIIGGLIGNVTYYCTMVATNIAGDSPASAIVTVTPQKGVNIVPILMLLLD